MALGKRVPKQREMWVATDALPRSPGHPFYKKLNQLLEEFNFDVKVERICNPFYKAGGRRSIPPGVYFRMLIVGYFEGISSQRGIAWRCSDSLSLRDFLGLMESEAVPDHSSLTVIRQRLPLEVHEEIFFDVLRMAKEKGLLKGKTVAIDSTTLEANAAMRSITRRDSGKDYKDYLRELMAEEGHENPNDEDLRRFDKKRKNKTTSNRDWESKSDPESRVAKMKDGRTHMAYKAENAVDLDTDLVISATVYTADLTDTATLRQSISDTERSLARVGSVGLLEEVIADKGYYDTKEIENLEKEGIRTYIPEPEYKGRRCWKKVPESRRKAAYRNRFRTRSKRGRHLARLRSERVERTFAHVCETGGGRRAWTRGLESVNKRYLIQVAARNLGLLMRQLFGCGTPRGLRGRIKDIIGVFRACHCALRVSRIPSRLDAARMIASIIYSAPVFSAA